MLGIFQRSWDIPYLAWQGFVSQSRAGLQECPPCEKGERLVSGCVTSEGQLWDRPHLLLQLGR